MVYLGMLDKVSIPFGSLMIYRFASNGHGSEASELNISETHKLKDWGWEEIKETYRNY